MTLDDENVLIDFDAYCTDVRLHDEFSLAFALVVVPENEFLRRVERVAAAARQCDHVARMQDLHDADPPSHFLLLDPTPPSDLLQCLTAKYTESLLCPH